MTAEFYQMSERQTSLLKMNKEEIIALRAELVEQRDRHLADARWTKNDIKKCDLIIAEWEKLEC